MSKQRILRVNSLLKEVISEVIFRDLHHIIEKVEFISITSVDVTPDLRSAKVYISVIGSSQDKEKACITLNDISGQIAHIAMKKVVMRIFPKLHFYIDEGLENEIRVCEILNKVLPKDDES